MKHNKPLTQLLSEQLDQPLSPAQSDALWADMAKRLEGEFPLAEKQEPEHLNDPAITPGPAAIGHSGWIGTLGFWAVLGLIGLSIFSAVAINARFNPSFSPSVPEQGDINPPIAEDAIQADQIAAEAAAAPKAERALPSLPKAPERQTLGVPSSSGRNQSSESVFKENYKNPTARKATKDGAQVRGNRIAHDPNTMPQDASVLTNANVAEKEAGSSSEQEYTSRDNTQVVLADEKAPMARAENSGARLEMPRPPQTSESNFWTDLQPLTGKLAALQWLALPLVALPTIPVTPVKRSRPRSAPQTNGLYFMVGSDLEKTNRLYQNFTPKGSYINVGVGGRVPLGRNWSLQPELWLLQLGTPPLMAVSNSIIDPEGARILRSDTVSIMRMRGWGFNLLLTKELPYGFSLLGGVNLARYSKVMQESAYSEKSLLNLTGGSGRSWNYSFTEPPAWFQQYQGGIKLGVEKLFYSRVVLGISMYKGLKDISLSPNGGGISNYPTNWVAYVGCRL